MSTHPTILQQFRSFCFQNNATNLETAIEYFAVFGGMGWKVDMSVPLDTLIEEKVLKNYRYIHGDIALITHSNPLHHKILSAIATGDRREHSAFKKSKIEREHGESSVDFLIDKGLLKEDNSVEKPMKNHEKVSPKLHFIAPFMRFWFSAISPYYKGIRDGDYSEFTKYWGNAKHEFANLIYEQLVMALIEKNAIDDPIVLIGGYWDTETEIDILARSKSGKWIAGACKHSKNKASKSELTKLKESVAKAGLDVDSYILYSKNKFTTELKKESGGDLQLYSLGSIGNLLEDLSSKDMLVSTNKKY
jgi:hypothetical protein